MKFIQSVLLLAFLGTIGLFAFQNNQSLTVQFANYSLTAPAAALIVGIYLLGMLTGWTVISYLRRSIRTATQKPTE